MLLFEGENIRTSYYEGYIILEIKLGRWWEVEDARERERERERM